MCHRVQLRDVVEASGAVDIATLEGYFVELLVVTVTRVVTRAVKPEIVATTIEHAPSERSHPFPPLCHLHPRGAFDDRADICATTFDLDFLEFKQVFNGRLRPRPRPGHPVPA